MAAYYFNVEVNIMARGTVVINSDRCKGCELCTTVCPQGVLEVADFFNARGYRPAHLVDPGGACTGCAICAVICPDSAITVYRLPARPKVVPQPTLVAA